MYWFYMCLKVSLLSECGSTMCACKALTFMYWFHVCLKVSFLSEWIHNVCMAACDLHVLILWVSEGCLSADPQCGHWNFWPSWTDFLWVWRCPFQVNVDPQCVHRYFWPSWTDFKCIWRCDFFVVLYSHCKHCWYLRTIFNQWLAVKVREQNYLIDSILCMYEYTSLILITNFNSGL